MKTMIQIVSAVIFVGLTLALRWGMQAAEWAWPDHGLAAVYVLGMPLLFGVVFYIAKKENGRDRDFWGNPVPASIDYDLDAQRESYRTVIYRWYIRLGVFVLSGLWLFSAYKILT